MWVIINREANGCKSARDSGHRQRFACVFLFFTLRFSNSLWSVSALDFSRSRLCSSWRIWACSNFVWVYGKRQREIQRRKKREAERKKRPIQIKEGDQNGWWWKGSSADGSRVHKLRRRSEVTFHFHRKCNLQLRTTLWSQVHDQRTQELHLQMAHRHVSLSCLMHVMH